MKTAADWAVTESRATLVLHRYLTASSSEDSGDSEEDETQTCDRAPALNHLLFTGDAFDPRPRRGSTEEQGDRLKENRISDERGNSDISLSFILWALILCWAVSSE